jgi:glucokinase
MLNAMHFQAVRFQRASLSERLLAKIALVGTDTGVGSCVALQVEGIVKAFAAECAQISLDIRVTFHVPVQQSLESEVLRADAAHELSRIFFGR